MFHTPSGFSSSTICGINSLLLKVMIVANPLHQRLLIIVPSITTGTNVESKSGASLAAPPVTPILTTAFSPLKNALTLWYHNKLLCNSACNEIVFTQDNSHIYIQFELQLKTASISLQEWWDTVIVIYKYMTPQLPLFYKFTTNYC
jgi:hypothetical protein